ncbi:hypothetical protein TNCV_2427501 [Trichonephila clavipes]|nr:hypothetical protein TNCV_2427501 [Trichonephila clavipes]
MMDTLVQGHRVWETNGNIMVVRQTESSTPRNTTTTEQGFHCNLTASFCQLSERASLGIEPNFKAASALKISTLDA